MRRKSSHALALVVVISTIAVGCVPPQAPSPPTTLAISASPGLFPPFSTSVPDYVSRCGNRAPVQVSVEAPAGASVSVAGQAGRSGRFTVSVTRPAGQAFTIVVVHPDRSQTSHVVRCLPIDFPTWTASHSGSTAAEWYLTSPLFGAQLTYPIIFDANGVPVWWGAPQRTVFSKLLHDGTIGSMVNGGVEVRSLDGSLVRFVHPVSGPADGHDILLLPNGDVVMVTDVPRDGVDLSAISGPASATVLDHVIEEIDASDGHVVWSWDVADHIPGTEMDPQWRDAILKGNAPYDVYHWNSIEDTGSGFIVSFRHLDAVFKIDMASNAIVWKLGGSTRPESLTVNDDPVFSGGSHFGGQHDARLLPDETVTLHDNGSNLGRAPRAVRYRIDEVAHTATLLESVVDPGIPASPCCGSARWLGPGDWLIGWGGTETGAESLGGVRHFSISFAGAVMYRLLPIAFGQLSRDALRAAMNAQWSAGGAATAQQAISGGPVPFPP